MKAKLNPLQSFALYSVIVVFVFVFYVIGLLIGRNDHEVAQPLSLDPPAPVEDVEPLLDFYQDLEKPQVEKEPVTPPDVASESPPPKKPTTGDFRYTIQVGAYSTEEEAEQMRIRLEASQFNPVLRPPQPQDEDPFYRVWVGEFSSLSQLKEKEDELRAAGFPTYAKKID